MTIPSFPSLARSLQSDSSVKFSLLLVNGLGEVLADRGLHCAGHGDEERVGGVVCRWHVDGQSLARHVEATAQVGVVQRVQVVTVFHHEVGGPRLVQPGLHKPFDKVPAVNSAEPTATAAAVAMKNSRSGFPLSVILVSGGGVQPYVQDGAVPATPLIWVGLSEERLCSIARLGHSFARACQVRRHPALTAPELSSRSGGPSSLPLPWILFLA